MDADGASRQLPRRPGTEPDAAGNLSGDGALTLAFRGPMVIAEPPRKTRDSSESLPDRIHEFRIFGRLGWGGFADVYLASGEGSYRPLALKVLREPVEERVREQVLCRFHAEEVIARAVDHPGIVRIQATSSPGVSPAYIAMEYVEGLPFCEHCRRSVPSADPAQLARLGREVALAMAAAHRLGIVHRDLKPDNVLVVAGAPDGDGDRIKILDFGIAKAPLGLFPRPQERAITRYVTELGTVMGSPPYMAPEQNGTAHAVTGRADVFSLGVMLLLAVTGAEESELMGPGHLLVQPEDVTGLLERGSALSPRWLELLRDMLAFEPERRPDMEVVARRLQWLAQPHEPMADAVEAWLRDGVVPSAGRLRRLLQWSESAQGLTADETRFLRHATAIRLGRVRWMAGVAAVGALSLAVGGAIAAQASRGDTRLAAVSIPGGAALGAAPPADELGAVAPATGERASPPPAASAAPVALASGDDGAETRRALEQCQRAQRALRAERDALEARLEEVRVELVAAEVESSAADARATSIERELERSQETAAEQGKQTFACRQELESRSRLLAESTERWRTCARTLRSVGAPVAPAPGGGAAPDATVASPPAVVAPELTPES